MSVMSFWVADTALDGAFHKVVVLAEVPSSGREREWWPVESPTGLVAIRCGCEARIYTGRAYCRHIDATLAHGERTMVPEQDHAVADHVQGLYGEHIRQPDSWKFSWRKDMRWRGFPSKSRTSTKPRGPRVGSSGLPVVCFTGKMERQRKEMIAEAVASGWEAADNVTHAIDVLVTGDPEIQSAKMRFAHAEGIPVLSCVDWDMLRLEGEKGLRRLALS